MFHSRGVSLYSQIFVSFFSPNTHSYFGFFLDLSPPFSPFFSWKLYVECRASATIIRYSDVLLKVPEVGIFQNFAGPFFVIRQGPGHPSIIHHFFQAEPNCNRKSISQSCYFNHATISKCHHPVRPSFKLSVKPSSLHPYSCF